MIIIWEQTDDWVYTFDNNFAEKLYGASPLRVLPEHSGTVRCCACCSALVDTSAKVAKYGASVYLPRVANHTARLSDIRTASESCPLCEILLRAAQRYRDDIGPDAELVREGAAIRIGQKGPRILRLCVDPGQCPEPPLKY
jgi:hypothetical protein